jgi:hypothetical protein
VRESFGVAISPSAFGLAYGTLQERAAIQQLLRSVGGNITIEAPGLALAGGLGSTTFTIGDVGDSNIRNSPDVRFDIYRFQTQKSALDFGRQSAVTTIKNLPNSIACPFGK